ncbi:Peroxisome chaperone and import receptor [Savitreella phatthalungensis]
MSVTKEEIDDLDDLDDLLDDFDGGEDVGVVEKAKERGAAGAGVTAGGSTAAGTEATVTKPDTAEVPDADAGGLPSLGNEDFAKQLQAGMEDLMAELNSSPEARKDFEALMAQMNAATINEGGPTTAGATSTSSYPNNASKKSATAATATKKPKNFQEQLNANIARMRDAENAQRERDDNAGLTDAETDLFMREMMKQFEGAAGTGNEGDFSKVLEGMMSQLMSKEILYEPLLELNQKYPGWLADNKTHKDYDKYVQQSGIVAQIVDRFEDPEYDDEDEYKKAQVMELMGQMQDLGSPPHEIMGEDLGMLDGGLPKMADGECSIM